MRFLGLVILLATLWQVAPLLSASLRHYHAASFWLDIGVRLPIPLLCLIGGVRLLRGRQSGTRFLVLAAGLLLAEGAVVLSLSLLRVLAPYTHAKAALRSCAVVAGLVLAVFALHRLVQRLAPCPPPEPSVSKPRWLAFGIALASVYLGCLYMRETVEQAASHSVAWGIDAYEQGRKDEAAAEWARVMAHFPRTSAWPVAVFNAGVHQKDQGRFQEAIARFELLLREEVDDRTRSGNLMEIYQNYRHRACVEISVCYEALRDGASALRFAILARDDYPFQSWCGTCLMENAKVLAARIEKLDVARR